VSLADLVAAILFAGVVAYALFGGADFGTGIWDLTAGDARRGGALRARIDASLGPVWEANHVWLVFVLVYLWTGFPEAFVSIMNTLVVPWAFVGLGIVLRGAAFAFRKFSATLGEAQLFGVMFATSSVVTPFFLGAIAGAVASGRVPADGTGDRWTSWTGPTSLVGGVLAVVTTAFLAATFLAADAERSGDPVVARSMGRRALGAGLVAGAVVLGGVLPLEHDAPELWDGLTGRAAVLVAISAVSGAATLVLLWRGRYAVARAGALLAVGAVVVGWGVAQFPDLLAGEVTIEDAAGARASLWGLVLVFAIAAVTVVPALVWLLRLVDAGRLDAPAHPQHDVGASPERRGSM
jgi:cytochrome d ubiquinol oxidase subunit II